MAAADGIDVPLLGEEEDRTTDIRGALVARGTTVLVHVWAKRQRTQPEYATYLGLVAEGAQKVSFPDPKKCVSVAFRVPLHPLHLPRFPQSQCRAEGGFLDAGLYCGVLPIFKRYNAGCLLCILGGGGDRLLGNLQGAG